MTEDCYPMSGGNEYDVKLRRHVVADHYITYTVNAATYEDAKAMVLANVRNHYLQASGHRVVEREQSLEILDE